MLFGRFDQFTQGCPGSRGCAADGLVSGAERANFSVERALAHAQLGGQLGAAAGVGGKAFAQRGAPKSLEIGGRGLLLRGPCWCWVSHGGVGTPCFVPQR